MKVYMGILCQKSYKLVHVVRHHEMTDISEVSNTSMTYEPFPHYHHVADRNTLFVVVENHEVATLFFEKISKFRQMKAFGRTS